jgi:hypothetical protein
MRRGKLISCLTAIVGIMMISIGWMIQEEQNTFTTRSNKIAGFDIKNMAANTNMVLKEKKEATEKKENPLLTEVVMETAPASVIIPPRVEVYEGMTLEEVAAQLEKTLKNELSGKGIVIASKSIELGVDPFVAAAVMMHETGCGQAQCSSLARNCYNFGGQKGKGCGAYKRYNSIDEGLEGIIYNLYKNYYAMGLNTVETIGPKYAESTTWAQKVNWYVNKMKNA